MSITPNAIPQRNARWWTGGSFVETLSEALEESGTESPRLVWKERGKPLIAPFTGDERTEALLRAARFTLWLRDHPDASQSKIRRMTNELNKLNARL